MGWQDAPVVEAPAWEAAPPVDEPKAKEAPARTATQTGARQYGLSARAAATGLMGLPLMVAEGIHKIGGTGRDPSGIFQQLLSDIGLPKPEDSTERVLQDVVGGVVGAGGLGFAAGAAKAAPGIGMAIKSALSSNMGAQLAASGAAGGGVGLAREAGAPPLVQLGAGLAAGVGVPMAYQAASKFVPNMVANSVRKSADSAFGQEGDRLAGETGIDLSLGARTGNKQVLTLENTARQYTPTADRVHNIDVKVANQAIDRVNTIADRISTNKGDTQSLGNQIEATVKGAAEKIDAMRNSAATVDYGRVREIAGNRPVIGMTNLQAELEKIISDYSQVVGPSSDATKIVAQAQSSLNTLKNTLGSTVGEAMKTRSFYGKAARGTGNVFDDLSPNIDRTLAARLFGAVNRDFDQTAETMGGALKDALTKANANYRNHSNSLEYLEKSAIGKLVGDDLVDAAMSGNKISMQSGEEIVKRIAGLYPSTRATSIEILDRWNPQLVKDLKANVLQEALDYGMSLPPSAKGASQTPISFNRFLSALGNTKVSFDKNLRSYGFSPSEINDIRDTASAMMRAGDRTGFNYSNTNVQADAMEVAGAMAGGAGAAAAGHLAGAAKMIGGAVISIAGKRIGLNRVADAMESEAGRKALKTVVNPRASPAAVAAAFEEISQ